MNKLRVSRNYNSNCGLKLNNKILRLPPIFKIVKFANFLVLIFSTNMNRLKILKLYRWLYKLKGVVDPVDVNEKKNASFDIRSNNCRSNDSGLLNRSFGVHFF